MKLASIAFTVALAFSQVTWAEAEASRELTDPENVTWVLEDSSQPGVLPGLPSFGWGQHGIGFDANLLGNTAELIQSLTTVEPAGGPE